MLMGQRFHRGFTAAEKTELWDRWKRGGIAEGDWTSFWQAVIIDLGPKPAMPTIS
jgi:hypothetical protein